MSTVVIQLEFKNNIVTKEEIIEYVEFLIYNDKLEYTQYPDGMDKIPDNPLENY